MASMVDVSAWIKTRAFAVLKVRSMSETEISSQRAIVINLTVVGRNKQKNKKRLEKEELSFIQTLAINVQGMIELANCYYAICDVTGNLNKDVRDMKSIGESLSENRILTVLKYHPENSFSFSFFLFFNLTFLFNYQGKNGSL